MTTKTAMATLFSISLFATIHVFGAATQTSNLETTGTKIFLSDSNSVEVAERGSGRIEPGASSGAFEHHSLG